jgi:hypothetical protein
MNEEGFEVFTFGGGGGGMRSSRDDWFWRGEVDVGLFALGGDGRFNWLWRGLISFRVGVSFLRDPMGEREKMGLYR